MEYSAVEAARALAAIEASRSTMRKIVRSHRGHYYLWLWGVIWVAMALLAEFRGHSGLKLGNWLALAGTVGSFTIGFLQTAHLRAPIDFRFLGLIAAIIGFAIVGPFVLRGPADPKAGFAYVALVVMLCYIVAGLWFDVYLLWLGLAIAALVLLGLFCFNSYFWWWIAVFGGGSFIGTGFYIRYGWN
jgi:hypothetical protein